MNQPRNDTRVLLSGVKDLAPLLAQAEVPLRMKGDRYNQQKLGAAKRRGNAYGAFFFYFAIFMI